MSTNHLGKPALSPWLSWPIVIIITLIFPPLGLIFIMLRLSADKSAALVSDKKIKTLGYIAAGIGILAFTQGVSGGIMFLLVGGFIVYYSNKVHKQALKMKQYIDLIANQQITQLDQISNITGNPHSTVHQDITQMIKKGYFKEAYINEATGEIIFPPPVTPKSEPPISAEPEIAPTPTPSTKFIQATCKSCGAHTRITQNETLECEYCGMLVVGS
ncbi:hypothetical protein [Caldalkalibacillus mannanilyticus]|uniref:hypothetical protein n=1 Tax=Caldalkalibacillus mannanilyticus TaxID=1418 RepID=UPI00046B0565|nr:hypothetical protein [Caldalkalibacillus mannanilyticus]